MIWLRINFLDEIRIDVRRTEPGQYRFYGIFPHFLGRPADPHLSLFADPVDDVLTPHFTAAGGGFRRTLKRIPTDALERLNATAEKELLPSYAAALEPVGLRRIGRERWVVPIVRTKTMLRWLRPGCRPGREFHLKHETMAMFAARALRHAVLPVALSQGAPAPGRFLAFRCDGRALSRRETSSIAEVRPLAYFPHGCAGPDAQGEIVRVHPPGWYWHPWDFGLDAVARRILTTEKFEHAVETIRNCLSRFPAAGVAPALTEAVPDFMSRIFWFYALDLFNLALEIAIKHDQSVLPPTSRHNASSGA